MILGERVDEAVFDQMDGGEPPRLKAFAHSCNRDVNA